MIAATLVLSALGVASPSAQGREGIKVHGDWVIEVRNADGTLAQRHEFRNALVVGKGDVTLATLLSRQNSTGRWEVALWPTDRQNGGICTVDLVPSRCFIAEPFPGAVSTGRAFFNLQAVNPGGTIELSGSATAAFAGDIKEVETALYLCPPTMSPTECTATAFGSPTSITRRMLPSAITVTAGQIVQVKVVLSFS